MKTSGSIVLYKSEVEVISEVIHSFFRGESNGRKLYLVDNSPTDELSSLANLYKSNIEYVFANANLGYGAGHNVAIRKSMEEGFEYHVVLNPDLSFEAETIPALEKFMDENKDVGVCSPDIMDYYDDSRKRALKLLPTPLNAFLRAFFHNSNLFSNMDEQYTLAFADYSKILESPYLSGCFMFFRHKALKEIGLFDENIFMYYEDADISRRMFRKYRVCCLPNVKAKHIADKATHKSRKMFWITVRSGVYYFNKYGWVFDSERRNMNAKTLKEIPRL